MSTSLSNARTVVRFGAFEFDAAGGELRKRGMKLKLEGHPILLLEMLLEHPGELVTRERVQRRLWAADTFVDFEQGINSAVKRLRQTLDDSAETPRYIETLPRRGYRFIYPVDNGGDAAAEKGVAAKPRRTRRLLTARRPVPHILLLVVAAALLAVCGAALLALRPRKPGPRGTPIRTLVVLPLVNLTGDAEQEFFVEGLHDELITEVAQIGSLSIISRSSAMHYRDSRKTAREIGRELGVDGVLEGTVRRSGSRIQVSAQLIRAATDEHLWAQSYEAEMADVLTIQNQVARAIARAVGVKISPGEQLRLGAVRVVSPAAHEAYLKGRYFREKRTAEGYRKGIQYFEQAIALDARYAPAYVGMAECYELLGAETYAAERPSDSLPRAEQYARRALQLDDNLSEAHVALAFALNLYEWDFVGAERAYRRAIELNPSNPQAHHWFALMLAANRRFAEALTEIRRARELDPLSVAIGNALGRILYYSRRYPDAVAELRSALDLYPDAALPRRTLGKTYVAEGRLEDGLRELRAAASGGGTVELGDLGYAYARLGRRREAEQVLGELRQRASAAYVSPFSLALVHLGLGNKEAMFAALDRAVEERSSGLVYMAVDPAWDAVRAESRFGQLLARLRLPAR